MDNPNSQTLSDLFNDFDEILNNTMVFSGSISLLADAVSGHNVRCKEYENIINYISNRMYDHAHRVDRVHDMLYKIARQEAHPHDQ